MKGHGARSLSERLDRDGPASVLKKAHDLGGPAPETARQLVTLHESLETLRKLECWTDVPEESVGKLIGDVDRRLKEGAEPDAPAEWRRPPFPETEEETRAMADELNPEGGEAKGPEGEAAKEAAKEAPVAAVAEEKKSAEAARPAAVKRAKEAEGSSSGVINLKALAEDYYKAKEARAAAERGEAASGAAGAAPRGDRQKKSPLPLFVAIAAGLIAVTGVLVYLLVAGAGGPEKRLPPGGPPAAEGPAISAAGPSAAPERVPPAPTAEEEELARLRQAQAAGGASADQTAALERRIAELEAQLAAKQAEPAALAPEPPAAPVEKDRPGAGESRAGSGTHAGPPRGTGERGGSSTPAAPPPPAEAPPPPAANPLLTTLAGGRPTTSAPAPAPSRDAGARPPASASGGGEGEEPGGRVVGSLEDLGIQTAQPPPPPPPPPPPAPVTPPPAPAPPEEILPETLGRPEIRRGAESVKAAVLGCGQGQTGTVTVEFTVSGETGGVTNARVTGEFAGSAVGACAENAARRAAFARFRRPTFTFTFPFVLPIQ